MPDPAYPRNASGQTYGSAARANSPANEPDLILVVADDGKEGYVRKADLDRANGMEAAKGFKSPAEALAWQANARAQGNQVIPVFDMDGKKRIGTFTVYVTEGEIVNGVE